MDRVPASADSPVVRPQTGGERGMLAYTLYGWMFGVVFYGISFWWVNEVSTLGYIPLMIFTEACFPASGLWSWECSSVRTPGRCPMRG